MQQHFAVKQLRFKGIFREFGKTGIQFIFRSLHPVIHKITTGMTHAPILFARLFLRLASMFLRSFLESIISF